jgi:hypothetical protein
LLKQEIGMRTIRIGLEALGAGRGPPPLKVLLLHDDLQAGLRAKRALDRVATNPSSHAGFLLNIHKLSLLKNPPMQARALTEARGADLVLLALNRIDGLPEPAGNWLDRWLRDKRLQECALIITLDECFRETAPDNPMVQSVRQIVTAAGRPFFLHFGDSAVMPVEERVKAAPAVVRRELRPKKRSTPAMACRRKGGRRPCAIPQPK